MPVAQKHDIIPEDEQPPTNVALPTLLDSDLFDEIIESLDKISQLKLEADENERKIAKLKTYIERADEMIEFAQGKRDQLNKKRTNLQQTLSSIEVRQREALEYWNNYYGLDIRQVSSDTDQFQQFEFIYKKLPSRIAQSEEENSLNDPNKHAPTNRDSCGKTECSINLRIQDKKFEIVAQSPEILSADKLNELGSLMSSECIHSETGHIDYRLAMKMIKKELVKALDP